MITARNIGKFYSSIFLYRDNNQGTLWPSIIAVLKGIKRRRTVLRGWPILCCNCLQTCPKAEGGKMRNGSSSCSRYYRCRGQWCQLSNIRSPMRIVLKCGITGSKATYEENNKNQKGRDGKTLHRRYSFAV